MKKRALIIGGYGNFGSFITERLEDDTDLHVIVAGRSLEKARSFATRFDHVEAARIDAEEDLAPVLSTLNPDIVIHTSGPFQGQGYKVAEACINHGCHYLDLADGRAFVDGISTLDAEAKKNGVCVISGASSVPCLSSALLDHYQVEFGQIDTVDYAITTAQQTNRGLATTAAILGYTGKPFATQIDGRDQTVHGWQGLHIRKFPKLGNRFLGYCDVPDLSLFPIRYPGLKTIRFYAGLEVPVLHLGLWSISWLVRWGLIRNLEKWASFLLSASRAFDLFGSADSGFQMVMSGRDKIGSCLVIKFDLTARSGDGPFIPCMPAIILAKKLAGSQPVAHGAYPCVGAVSKDEYLKALSDLDIEWEETRNF